VDPVSAELARTCLAGRHSEAAAFAEERLRAISAATIAIETGLRIEVAEPSEKFHLTDEHRTTICLVLDVEEVTDDVVR
jgi:hypothetical protein